MLKTTIMSDTDELLPVNSCDLIEFLDRMHPHECIRPGESVEQAHRRAGCRELIDFLIQWHEDTLAAAHEDTGRDGP